MTPTLATDRLVLRPLALQDLDAYADFWGDPQVVRHITGTPVAREQSWRRLLASVGHWQLLGFGFFALEERATGRFIGEAGFQEMHRELAPSIEGTLETGWAILPAFQGKGYASEAVGAAMRWAGAAFPALAFSCIIDPHNQASLRLAARLGFVEDAPALYSGKTVIVLRKGRAAAP
jgi:RimJ/RimL family protein N-acetyltransferase